MGSKGDSQSVLGDSAAASDAFLLAGERRAGDAPQFCLSTGLVGWLLVVVGLGSGRIGQARVGAGKPFLERMFPGGCIGRSSAVTIPT